MCDPNSYDYVEPDIIDNPNPHPKDDNFICCYNRKVFKCMRRWNCNPRDLFNRRAGCAHLWFIFSILLLAFGVNMYRFQNNPDNYYGSALLVPTISESVFQEIASTKNCSVNYELDFTTSLGSCTDNIKSTSCADSTCLSYAQQCSPCAYVCYTTDCWVPAQQQPCIDQMTAKNCKVYYAQKMTTYTCEAYYPNIISLCNQTCPDLTCQSYNPTCNCVNTTCQKQQNTVCSYDFVSHNVTNVIVDYNYKVDNVSYRGINFTTSNIQIVNNQVVISCLAKNCIDELHTNYSEVISVYYPFSDKTQLLTERPTRAAGITIAMISVGAPLLLWLTICVLSWWTATLDGCKKPPPEIIHIAPLVQRPQQIQMTPIQPAEHKMSIHPTNFTCTLCTEKLMEHDMKVLKCSHIFHKNCIEKLEFCPLCIKL